MQTPLQQLRRRALEKRREQPPVWVEHRCHLTPHVEGRYTEATFDVDGLREEQRVVAHCTVCGQHFQRTCASGAVRQHIQRFSVLHQHKDVLAAPAVERPGSLRRTRADYGDDG